MIWPFHGYRKTPKEISKKFKNKSLMAKTKAVTFLDRNSFFTQKKVLNGVVINF